jgi:chitin binding protein
MLGFNVIRPKRRHMLGRALLAGAAAVFVPGLVHAHFILVTPDAWMSQDAFGLPEKLGPCGDEGGGTPTGKVTEFQPGETITVTIDEVIPHPGHYRVALAVNNRSELPPEPQVTPSGFDPCASAATQSPPVFPILEDNVLPHTQPFATPQTFTVTLPSDVTCTKCTLQVLEFMSNHGAPCFYHHCADISIQPALETSTVTPLPTATDTQTPTTTPAQAPTSTQIESATQPPTETPPPLSTPTPTARPCVGDCDRNQSVTIDEVVLGIRILLGEVSLGVCPALDSTNEGALTVDELVTAVHNALSGCPGAGFGVRSSGFGLVPGTPYPEPRT